MGNCSLLENSCSKSVLRRSANITHLTYFLVFYVYEAEFEFSSFWFRLRVLNVERFYMGFMKWKNVIRAHCTMGRIRPQVKKSANVP